MKHLRALNKCPGDCGIISSRLCEISKHKSSTARAGKPNIFPPIMINEWAELFFCPSCPIIKTTFVACSGLCGWNVGSPFMQSQTHVTSLLRSAGQHILRYCSSAWKPTFTPAHNLPLILLTHLTVIIYFITKKNEVVWLKIQKKENKRWMKCSWNVRQALLCLGLSA